MFNLKKYSLARLYCGISLLFLSRANQAALHLTDLLTTDTPPQNQIISFLPTSGMSNLLTGVHLHYLTSSDCYSGYAGSFYSLREWHEHWASEEMSFMLRADGAYLAGISVLGETKITTIHSILIRFTSEEHENSKSRFAFFLGGCEDQDINCCIPVNCSDQTKRCLPQQQFPIQYLFWR